MTSLPLDAPVLTRSEADEVFANILDLKVSAGEIEAFLIALSARGETAVEIAAAAQAMRERVNGITAPDGAVDCCGTGGDGQHTLNVSTAVSLVVAACGVPVAKHGNRAASSKSGAADTLEALGLDMEAAVRCAEKTLHEIGIGFLFARVHHPALGPIAPIREKIGKRTIFNLLGPLTNPAGVRTQLIGLASPDLVPTYAEAKASLDQERCFIVSGDEGLDELSLAGDNTLADVSEGKVTMRRVNASVIGVPNAPLEAIRGDDAQYNAAALTRLLDGEKSAYRDAVLLNAAGTLLVAGKTEDWQEGASLAAEAIDNGAAKQLLAKWIELTV
ncbi:anthranilate phosphoribosyltransferase [Erythrobacter sp. SCSIO 43205]|uniref:anthranilate phosphoribosyltransferase n=1 Tax=Erythrobacter sp. SCSIO 43205 TaxID=2779361 RepID=UPI001CA7EB29|nr:anthranilate phosphoribosyltransferase [Erythrobacter sp. SCSIO 43205]UAB77219.1 anthranilate phosphoribosyltransferase [Erythrobacter sp. SCSIO 43205]